MNIMRALISIDRLQIHAMSNNTVLVANPVPSQHIPRHPTNLQGLPTIIPLHNRHHIRTGIPLLHQPPQPQTTLPSQRDIRQHVSQLHLNQLVRPQGQTELFPLAHVLFRPVHTVLGGTQHPPRNTVPRVVQTPKRTFQTLHRLETIRGGDTYILHENHTRGTGTEAKFPLNRRRRQPTSLPFPRQLVLVNEKPANLFRLLILRPNHKHIRNGRIRNPILRPVQHILIRPRVIHRGSLHRARITPVIRLR
mmetsp:Transcript_21526/g.26633  ORF Transcript_21526/g.26633 Transcript_21526/m.26633 type:complete len:250 (-) Transcript_21526:959-1708(-)